VTPALATEFRGVGKARHVLEGPSMLSVLAFSLVLVPLLRNLRPDPGDR
jgi:hypothetical protein